MVLRVSEDLRGVFPEVVDSTIRNEMVTCQTKGYWSFHRQLGPKGGSVDLVAGGAFAKGLEVIRLKVWAEKMPFPQALTIGAAAAIAEYGEFVDPKEKEAKSVMRVVDALAFYFERYPIDKDPIRPYFWDTNRPAVEYTFAIPLPINHPVSGMPLIYGGRTDWIGRFNEPLFICDEKTASQLGPTWGTKWDLRGQFTGYVWAARETGLEVAGAIVRGISFLKNSFGAQESIQYRTKWEVERWYEQLLIDLENAVKVWKSGVFNQVLGDACEGFNGCPFSKLCKSQNPEPWTINFSPRPWNPLSHYPRGKPEQEEASVVPLGFTLPT